MVDVLNIPMYDGSFESAVNEVISSCRNESDSLCISATSAHGLVHSLTDKEFERVLRDSYLNLPDGLPVVWVGRLKGAKEMERCYGPDFFKGVMIATKDEEVKHFFCGGKEGVAKKLKHVCEQKFGNHNCVGTFSPPFREIAVEEFRSLGDMINRSRADIVWIGLSTPKQEVFAKRLSNFVKVKFIITVGAAFDFHTGKVREAPIFMQNIGLEWFFRLIMEPRRLLVRYFKVVPAFLYYGTIDVTSFYYRKITGRKYANS